MNCSRSSAATAVTHWGASAALRMRFSDLNNCFARRVSLERLCWSFSCPLSTMLQDDEAFEEFAESGLRLCAELQSEVPTRVSACAWFSSSQLAVCGDDGTVVLHEIESTGTSITIMSTGLRSQRTAN
jgi:hypothetical protein